MHFISLEEVDSTNLYAKKHLEVLEDKTVITAARQTAGRGRLSRSWLDLGDGNLFVSIVLKPSENFDNKFANLTQYLSVMICKTLESYGIECSIKWPNDVLVKGKKIAGILCETVMQGAKFKGLVLGFGVNITAGECDVKKVADKAVTSLFLEMSSPVPDKVEFLNNLLNYFFNDYNKFIQEGFSFIKHDYLSRTDLLNRELKVSLPDGVKCGSAISVDDCGALHLKEKETNKELVLTIGDIL